MYDCEKKPTGLVHAADELRKLILENPDLPLVVEVGEEANSGDYSYMFSARVSAVVGEFLDCEQNVKDERAYTDREEFSEDLADKLYESGEYDDMSENEFDALVEKELEAYEPFWKKCIIVTVD